MARAVGSEDAAMEALKAGRLVTVREAAVLVGMHEYTIRGMISDGRLPGYGGKGRIRVDLADLVKPIAPKRRRKPSPARRKARLWVGRGKMGY